MNKKRLNKKKNREVFDEEIDDIVLEKLTKGNGNNKSNSYNKVRDFDDIEEFNDAHDSDETANLSDEKISDEDSENTFEKVDRGGYSYNKETFEENEDKIEKDEEDGNEIEKSLFSDLSEDGDITIDEKSRKRLLEKGKQKSNKDNKEKTDKIFGNKYSNKFNRELTDFFGRKTYEEVNKKIGNVDSKAFDINLSSDSSKNESGIKKFSKIEFNVNDFELKGKDKISSIDDTYINRSYWKDIFYHFVKNKGAVVGFVFIILITLMALLGPALSQHSYNEQSIENQNLPPRIPLIEKLGIFDGYQEIETDSGTKRINKYLGIEVTDEETTTKSKSNTTIEGESNENEEQNGTAKQNKKEDVENNKDNEGSTDNSISTDKEDATAKESNLKNTYYWFGTDVLGRDIFTRTWMGTRISLYIALIAVVVDMIFGLGYGLISGYFGGVVDNIMQRIPEILSGIPDLVIVTLLILIFKPGLVSITLAIMITGWISMNRIARAQMLKLKEQEFVLAARTLGANSFMIIFKEILPNIFGQVITNTMFSIPNAIFTEAFLAFIGLGIPAPMASLGSLISEGFKSFTIHSYMIVPPVIVLAILMLSFNLLADGLRDAFDPKMKER